MIGTDRAGCELESGVCGVAADGSSTVQTEVDNDWMDGTCTKEMDGWIDG